MSYLGTVLGVVAGYVFWGWEGVGVIVLLAILETTLSFDNAVMNASILRRMGPLGRRLFLTVGVLIAVFGMRALFPLLLVVTTAHISFAQAWELAINPASTVNGFTYAQHLDIAHPAIAAFGGMFLMMIGLEFLFDNDREIHWIKIVERPLAKLGNFESLAAAVSLSVMLLVATRFAPTEAASEVMIAGTLGLIVYVVVGGLSKYFEQFSKTKPVNGKAQLVVGKAAVFLFLYLEILDASFSFDGVIGAFAITTDVLKIMIGLGIGALFVRSLTIQLLNAGALQKYKYLEHGAHYAILFLAIVLWVSIAHDVPEGVSAGLGAVCIGAALAASVLERRGETSKTKLTLAEEQTPLPATTAP